MRTIGQIRRVIIDALAHGPAEQSGARFVLIKETPAPWWYSAQSISPMITSSRIEENRDRSMSNVFRNQNTKATIQP